MNVTDPGTEVNPSIALISAAWQDSLTKSNLDWFNHRGYLSYDLDDNLAVLTLNTVPYSVRCLTQDEAEGTELVPLFMSAAISLIYDNNPAFMVWDFDAITYEVLDYTVYGSNISSASQSLGWQPLFKASTEYAVSSLRTSELNAFVNRAASNPALLEQYYYNSKARSYRQSSCQDAACQAKWLCTMQWFTTSEDFQACVSELEAARSTVATSC
ncbi:unnamed protein product [Phytophthora lilii]|uniref:Unnamed protein product n=1 Tax=Phytophthora lilii TaxID=2077276 RepID=A0A9W6X5M8_9STRA|nr:unnamed protein product [Phytophthora lilii]